MHSIRLLLLAILGLLVIEMQAQRDYSIYLAQGQGATPIPEMYTPEQLPSEALSDSEFQENYYLALQFTDVPTETQRTELQELGVELLGYIPNYAYLAKVSKSTDFSALGARAIFVIPPEYKLSKTLVDEDFPAYAMAEEGVQLHVLPQPNIMPTHLLESLKQSGFGTGEIIQGGLALVVPSDRIHELASHPAVMYVQLAEPPPTAEGLTGRSSLRANLAGTGPNAGFDGSGIGIAIADDGSVSHIDFKGRLTNFTDGPGGNHGDMTAGLAAGAGNLDPLGMGMAPGAHLYLYSIQNYPHIGDAVQNLFQRTAPITSTSYGEGCGGIYTQTTQFIDRQVYQNPELLHFFSAGNSGTVNCSIYSNFIAADGTRYGNITGGRKAAKNVMTIGNVFYDDRLLSSSSRGPTLDGRIKPDLVAHGQGNLTTDVNNGYRLGGGTSAAAPTAAGAAALLYEAYRERHNNLPSSALIKAAMLNTAEDLGAPGPDYQHGWGRVHVGRALDVLENNQFVTATITNGAKRSHNISVPQGVSEVRVMVYWHDADGLPFAGKALVNDLDMTLESPAGQIYRPWVLSTTLHRDSLGKPAYRGEDHVNNVEQITLDDPTSGNYNITIDGHLVPGGTQRYYLVYHFVREALAITYPVGGEGFVPGETEVIRWDAIGNTGRFTLEYSTNNGASWQIIAGNIAGSARHFDWQVPNIAANQVRIRVRRSGQSAVSPAPFSIIDLPNFNILYKTDRTATISWQPVPGANRYDVYALGNQFMEIIGTTDETNLDFNINLSESNWFSVRARNTSGAVGRRAIAQRYQHRPCDHTVTLNLAFDLYPNETSWDIRDADNRVWASGGPYSASNQNDEISIDICLPEGCFNLNVYDSYGDGMCCNGGRGSYRLTDANGDELASGDQFGSNIRHGFCLQDVQTSPLFLQIQSQRNVSCFQQRDGSVVVTASGGTGSYSYSWSNGAASPVLNNLGAGTYRVTVSDGRNQAARQVVITEPDRLQIQLSAEFENCSEEQGLIVANAVGGTPPYDYAWSDGSRTSKITDIAQSTYRVTVTDGNGCTATSSINVAPMANLSVSLTARNVTCFGGTDGQSTALVSGGLPPYQFIWSNGTQTATAANLNAGIHAVTVTDSRGCEATAAVNIGSPPAINIAFDITHAFGTTNGSIRAAANGGLPGYAFQWSNGARTAQLSDLGPGTYTVTVTDSRGCVAVRSASVQFQDPADCSARGANTRFEWIESVRIGAMTNISGNDGGYGNYRDRSQTVLPGERYTVLLTPGFANDAFREFWRIWVDVNQDGDFLDDGEEVFAANGATTPVGGSFRLPTNTMPGLTNVRVSMRYGAPPLPCGTFPYGEVEDYSLFVASGSQRLQTNFQAEENESLFAKAPALSAATLSVFPNPSNGEVTLAYQSQQAETIEITIFDAAGKLILRESAPVATGENAIPLTMKHLARGSYMLKIRNAQTAFTERIVIAN